MGGKEPVMELPRKQTQEGAGSRRVDPEEEKLRDLSNAIVHSSEFKQMSGFVRECHEEETKKIEECRGEIEKVPDSTLLKYRRGLKRSTSRLLQDLNMYDIATREGNKKRVAHMERSAPWFQAGYKPLSSISKNPSAPAFLTFSAEQAPGAGSQRVFHKNTLYIREPNTYKDPASRKVNYSLCVQLEEPPI
ncbi:unnamed protein product [Amoebophrya sp. A25]|nr:unnamed protein product [Amoebophrya sp. A25]|eukprot:GSA25T00027227001.1